MMDEYGWSAWYVEYNPASDMFDVYSRKEGETRVHSSWCTKAVAEDVAERLNGGEQL